MNTAKKAVVVGGSNGIGLGIAKALIAKGYTVQILDQFAPDASMNDHAGFFEYTPCNLLDFDATVFEALASDPSVDCLMITAGVGRVADFEYLHITEIQRLIELNTVAGIKIVRLFYERIKGVSPFYCGMMGSIAGLVSSPMFSVYAASKAALCRFIESVNIELECAGTQNRILNVSPGSIQGTRFNGQENKVDMTAALATEITEKLLRSEPLYIPEYAKTFKDVLARYHADPHAFGLSSYQYKKASGRVKNEKKAVIGYLSGTFDLFHVGHLNLLERAKNECDYLIVGVHPDASHKGKETFIPYEERVKILRAIRYVDKVVQSCPEDADAWPLWHFDKLFVGSDYKGTERFNRYEKYFADKGVEIVYFPYTQSTNSTQIRKLVLKKSKDVREEQ